MEGEGTTSKEDGRIEGRREGKGGGEFPPQVKASRINAGLQQSLSRVCRREAVHVRQVQQVLSDADESSSP